MKANVTLNVSDAAFANRFLEVRGDEGADAGTDATDTEGES